MVDLISDPNGKERKEIDLEITHLEESIRVLKSRRNALSPISKLPCEILNAIFMLILLDSPCPNSENIIKMTHVCRNWRYVTLNHPLLWTRIILVNRSGIRPEIMKWSKEAPLCVRFQSESDHYLSSPAINFIPINIHRIQELTIDTDLFTAELIMNSLDAPALQLRAVALICDGDGQGSLLPSLSRFFDGHIIPCLRRLMLADVNVNWKWPVFSHLTELRLEDVSPPLPISALRNMPYLRVLESKGGLPRCPIRYIGRISQPDVVELRFMHKLSLHHSSFRSSSYFLNHLRFPPAADVNLWIIPDRNDFIYGVPPLCRAGNQVQVVWKAGILRFATPSITVTTLAFERPASGCLCVAFQTLSMSSGLEYLDLKMDSSMDSDWSAVLRPMIHLIQLNLNLDCSGRSLLRTLLAARPAVEGQPSGSANATQMLLPRLHLLTLRIKGSKAEVQGDFNILRDLLHVRCAMGARISEVRVRVLQGEESMLMSSEELGELSGLVDVLHLEM